MERHVLVIRCWHVVLFLTCHVDGFHKNVMGNTSNLASGFVRGIKCDYGGLDHSWSCRGDKLLTVPYNLTSTSDKMTLKLEDAGIKILYNDSLTPYASILTQLYLINVPEFHSIMSGIFQDTAKLQTIYISHAPKLTFVDDEVFNVHLPQLKEIRILRAALIALPYLGKLIIGETPLKTLDFENNKIQSIETAWIKTRSEDLLLNYNEITSVKSMAFNGSQIARLSFKGNIALTSIHSDAFAGLESIQSLDLSGTSITALPTTGLEGLHTLNIINTTTLNAIPSVYNFQSIAKAYLTYPYHCCAFKFPAKHDPEMHKKYNEEMERITKSECPASVTTPTDTDMTNHQNVTTSRPTVIGRCNREIKKFEPANITCTPEPDAFNPCEDIMGYWELRIAVWFVALLSIVGNLAVLVVLASTKVDMTVPKFLMCNLAWADLCMGIYLTLIAGMDAHSIGEYFNHAIGWQRGLGCQVAGFLTVFSTELSIFTLTIITIERWYTITYAIHLNRRLTLNTSARIMFVGWIYACIMAALPLADISGYAKTSICLPLENRDNKDLLYLTTLLVFTGLAFFVIVICYGCMYSSVQGSREEASPMARSDMTVAKKMALLVLTDFVCWAPVAFFAVTALVGRPLINVTNTKILLVFVYPLNSCANPYLYALLTHQYRRDLFTLLSRHGMCNERAAKYKGTTIGLPMGERMINRGMCNRRTADNLQRTSSVLTTSTLPSSDLSVAHTEKTAKICSAPQSIMNNRQGAMIPV